MVWSIVIPVMLVATLAIGVEAVLAMRTHPAARTPAYIVVAGVVAFPVAIILHNALSALIRGEEAVSFILALFVAPAAITFGTIGLALALRSDPGTRQLALGFGLCGAGLVLFVGYSVFALVMSSLVGSEPSFQATVEVLAVLLAALAMVGGALFAGLAIVARPRGAAV